MDALNQSELLRYNRQILLSEIGVEGQKKLKAAKVVLVGLGGLGSPCAFYLAGAGVGHLVLCDGDRVDLSNLQRQILHTESRQSLNKAKSAKAQLESFNSLVTYTTIETHLDHQSILEVIKGSDLVIDGSDNFSTRYLVNDACVKLKIPLISAAVYRFCGQVTVLNLEGSGCYRCLYPEFPHEKLSPNCAQAGVLGVLPGILGSLQALEALKILLDLKGILKNRLLIFDALSMSFREMKYTKKEDCICQKPDSIFLNSDFSQTCSSQVEIPEISVQELKKMIDSPNNFQCIDVRNQDELKICHLENFLCRPLGSIEKWQQEFNPQKTTILLCRSGRRSLEAARILKKFGFQKLINVRGGILDWLDKIDSEMDKY